MIEKSGASKGMTIFFFHISGRKKENASRIFKMNIFDFTLTLDLLQNYT